MKYFSHAKTFPLSPLTFQFSPFSLKQRRDLTIAKSPLIYSVVARLRAASRAVSSGLDTVHSKF